VSCGQVGGDPDLIALRQSPYLVGVKTAEILAAAAILAAAGCGSEGAGGQGASSAPEPNRSAGAAKKPAQAGRGTRPQNRLRRARCPAGAANCRSAEGTIIYLERVDPDGDGDAHFVLLSDQSVTGPGLSVIDVEKALRPHPLPGVGDRVSAAGPVYRGSYGQRQIQATEVFTAAG
jgi:hypothetical protein